MRSFIRRLSTRGEFILVMSVGFGPVIAFQLLSLIRPAQSSGPATAGLSNIGLLVGLIGELVLLAAVLGIRKLRGWSLATFGSRISWCGAAGGALLFVVAQLTETGAGILVQKVHPTQTCYSVAGISIPVILLFAFIWPIFEELLEAGYIIHSLQRFGMWHAVLASALVRGLFHWSQGIYGVSLMFVVGLIFGLAYWRWRQLWPLVVAHALMGLYAAWNLIR